MEAAGGQGLWRPSFSGKAGSTWGSGVASRGRPAPAHTLGPPKVSAGPPPWSRGGALPTTKVKPRHDLRCRRTQQIPSSGLSPPGGGGSAASPHTRAGPVAARAALALLTVLQAGEALLTPRPAQGAGHRQPWAVCGWRVAAGGVTSRPARVRGDEETASEAGLPCSR